MDDFLNSPLTDPDFLNLKSIATRGGERGPLYDQGVLSVVNQIEAVGSYVPSRLLPLVDLHKRRDLIESALTPDEIAELEQELANRGWTTEQGAEYARGVWQAEVTLKRYRWEPPEADPPTE